MDKRRISSGGLAVLITKRASKQTYYTIRMFVDRDRIEDAYRSYAYFRWVDDVIDESSCLYEERIAFTERQKFLLEACYRGETPAGLCAEERMLADLIQHDTEKNSGLQIYLRNMMDVMIFDAWRRGRVISQAELLEYSHRLAKAVTEALYYFIGHGTSTPCHEARYLAVTAAHITHMLRDGVEDVDNGYYNIPREIVSGYGLSPRDLASPIYREWVCSRVKLAREYFKRGRECTSQVKNLRCRLAGFAYIARFEWILDAIERDRYCLRSEYSTRKSLRTAVWIIRSTLASMIASFWVKTNVREPLTQSVGVDKR